MGHGLPKTFLSTSQKDSSKVGTYVVEVRAIREASTSAANQIARPRIGDASDNHHEADLG